MKEYSTEQIRNVALISHNGAGKTTLVERILFDSGVLTRMGSVQNGNAAMDFDPEEAERQGSISTALAPIEINNHKLNLLDTPGYFDFVGEVNAALRVADGALLFVEAVAGVEVGTEIMWTEAHDKRHLPIVLVINKMDRENARVSRVMTSLAENLPEARFINLQLPIGEAGGFKGVVDLVHERAYLGEKSTPGPIPANMADTVEEARLALVEVAAEGDDELLEKYFDDQPLTAQEIIRGLKASMKKGGIVPVIYCSGQTGVGVTPLLETVLQLLPAPHEAEPTSATDKAGHSVSVEVKDKAPLAALIFKTREDAYGKTSFIRIYSGVLDADSRVWDSKLEAEVRVGALSVSRGKEQIAVTHLHAGDIGSVVKLGDVQVNHTLCLRTQPLHLAPITQPNPIYSVAIHPESQSDMAKLSEALARLMGEDMTLHATHERATHEQILWGMGDVHLAIAVKKLASKFGVNVTTSTPKVPFRETITKTNSAEYTHKKQTGGAGQYARVFLRVESLPDDAEFEFTSEVFGGAVSAPFVAATEKGCRQALESGALAGYPLTGVRCIVYDGKEHPVDSKEIAFQVAGREGFKKAVLGADPVLLEPLYNVQVIVPNENMGDIMSDLNTRRAKVSGMEQIGTRAIVRAEVPLEKMQRYLVDLRSMTQGRGVYSMEFSRYGRMPAHLQQQLDEAAHKEHHEE